MNNASTFYYKIKDFLTSENLIIASIIILSGATASFLIRRLVKKGKISYNLSKLAKYIFAIILCKISYYYFSDNTILYKIFKTIEILAFGILLKVLIVDYYYLEFLKKRNVKTNKIIADLLKLIILIILTLYFLRAVFEVNLATILTPSAILTAVIGLSMQDTIGNLISGLIIQLEKPFEIGDWIDVGGLKGEVTEINWRYTKIKNIEDIYIIVPNNVIAKDKVINFSKPTRHVNQIITIGVSYSASPLLVKSSIKEVVNSQREAKLINVLLKEYGDSSIVYDIYYTVNDYSKIRIVRDSIYSGIWYKFKSKGIEIPFPIRTVIMKSEEKEKMISDELLEKIKNTDIFSELNENALKEFLNYGILREYNGGETVVKEGESGETMFFVIEGSFDVIRGDKTIGEIKNGDFFGEMSLLTGEKRYATVVAKEFSKAIEIDREAFKVLLEKEKKIIDKLKVVLDKRIKEKEESFEEKSSKKLKQNNLFERFKKIFKV